jgi:hypothetical protein
MQVWIFKIDPGTGEKLGLLATATVGENGWVDLGQPIIVRAGDAFIAVRESMNQSHANDPVILVACCGPKLAEPAPAADLYVSSLFKKARA